VPPPTKRENSHKCKGKVQSKQRPYCQTERLVCFRKIPSNFWGFESHCGDEKYRKWS